MVESMSAGWGLCESQQRVEGTGGLSLPGACQTLEHISLQFNSLRSVVLKPEQPMDLRIRCVCSSTLILNRPHHCLCGGIVFKANCLCFLLISKENVCQEFKAIYAENVNPYMGHDS